MALTGSERPDLPRPLSVEERVARLEAKIEHVAWWRNPGWWGVILSAFVGLSGLAWQTKPWKLFQAEPAKPASTVKLIDGHASAFAKNQWSAYLRVVNGTSGDIVVERVTATFGARSYGKSCRNGQATRVLYPVSQLRTGSPRNIFQRIHPGEGAPFTGGPNIDRVFGGGRACPLSVARLRSPQDRVTFIVFTSDGAERKTKQRLFYEPRAQVRGSGLPCGVFLFFPFGFC